MTTLTDGSKIEESLISSFMVLINDAALHKKHARMENNSSIFQVDVDVIQKAYNNPNSSLSMI